MTRGRQEVERERYGVHYKVDGRLICMGFYTDELTKAIGFCDHVAMEHGQATLIDWSEHKTLFHLVNPVI